jgi:Putative peptidoglycan binding domain
MKKFTTLMTMCSLVLAGAVMAQQPTPEESKPPGKTERHDKKAPTEVKPKATIAPKTEAPPTKDPATSEAPGSKHDKSTRKSVTPADTKAPSTSMDQPAASVTPSDKKIKSNDNRKDKKAPSAAASTTPATEKTTPVAKASPTPKSKATSSPAAATASSTPAPSASTTPAAKASTTPVTAASTTPAASAAASASAAPTIAQTSPSQSVNPKATKKLEPQKVEQIKQQHTSFRAQPRPDRVPAVTFSAGFRLPGVERWQGPQYEVYRSYHPERHDRGWYSQHHQRVELVAGGYYYFDNGYWYPAWGYDSAHEYYAYDAPIYVGKRAEPPDRVIADVQAALQDMGYYKGEVDGLIGPLTREALTAYQTDQGMVATAVIDEPTLDALGMG